MDDQLSQDVSQLWSMLFSLVLDAEKRLGEHLSAQGLTSPQFYVLKTLSENDSRLGIGQIARQHGLTNATMTGLIKRMEAMNPPLVERKEDPNDRRAVFVYLTPIGMERYLAVQKTLFAQLYNAFGLIPEEERAKLLEQMERYVQLLRMV